jgi:hypothetical protein
MAPHAPGQACHTLFTQTSQTYMITWRAPHLPARRVHPITRTSNQTWAIPEHAGALAVGKGAPMVSPVGLPQPSLAGGRPRRGSSQAGGATGLAGGRTLPARRVPGVCGRCAGPGRGGSQVDPRRWRTAVHCTPAMSVQAPGWQRPGLLRAVTRGVIPLPLGGARRLPRCCCLLCLLAVQTALTPSADPPGKPGLHHAHLPLFHGRAMASQAGRVAAPPADPGL